LKIPSHGGVARSDNGRAAPGWVVLVLKTPLKSPFIQGGTVFPSNVAPQRGMKKSPGNLIRGFVKLWQHSLSSIRIDP
jgi:hypothetical protein